MQPASKILYFLISTLIVGLVGCSHSRKISSSSNLDLPQVSERIPKAVIYDTLSGIFFYENDIQSYVVFDAITGGNGFIHTDSISELDYKNGYIESVFASGYITERISSKGVNIRFDKASISRFYDSTFLNSVSGKSATIKPFCGGEYIKYNMKIEVAYIDTVSRKIPLFLDCNGYDEYKKKNERRNYKIAPVPTYVITKIFSWQEL